MAACASQPLLDKQLEQLVSLESLLKEEKNILTKHNPDALNAITEKKEALLNAIQSFDLELSSNMQFLEDKKQGLVEESLTAIQEALSRCQELNEVNGNIINHSQLAVEKMKTTLLERHNKSSITYDNKGKKSAGLSSLNIKA